MSNPAATPVVQNAQTNNAKYVSIIPENGTTFVAGQKVVFNLDPSLGFIKGRDSYLVFEIVNKAMTPYRYVLKKPGISSVIKQVNIFSQHNGMLLETLDDYNKWTSCEMEYRYDDYNNLCNTEGALLHQQAQKGLEPATDVSMTPNYKNTYSEPSNHRFTQTTDNGTPQTSALRLTCPLRCGIFRHWDDEALVPILMMGGLRIELILAPPEEVFELVYLKTHRKSHPNFVVNQHIPIANEADTSTVVRIVDDGNLDHKDTPFVVGSEVHIFAQGGIDVVKTITAVDNTGGAGHPVKLTLDSALGTAIGGAAGRIEINPAALTVSNLKYELSQVEFRLLQEQPPKQMNNMEYVFTSYDLFRDTIPQTQRNFNQDIASVASKAVSLFTMYEDPQYDDISNLGMNNYYMGVSPDNEGINMNSIVYFINNKLYPLQAYNPSRYGDRVINQNELVKAWGTLNIPVKSLGSSEYADLGQYTNRYLHARELARGNSVFNLQNAEPQIRVGFSAARGNNRQGTQVGNLRMITFVFSKKILKIDGNEGLSLIH
jgi:hypothetical protein